ncbi:Crp/Fnr family transcriptional regulator [Intrasporangium mesophilum]
MTIAVGLLSDLEPEERRRVLARMRRRTYAAGEVVFHEGDPADALHFLVEGRVVAKRFSAEGDRVAYSVIGPGQAFGELAMLARDGRRTATIQAIEPTTTLVLTFSDFERLCAEQPSVARLLTRLLAARVGRLTEALMEALHTPADLRVVRRLVDLFGLYARDGGRPSALPLPITQTELSELAGVTRPTANRVLRRLESAGIVKLGRGTITVVDAAALRAAADGSARA